MNIRQLRIFQTVSELGSITKASEALYMSQPAVSSTIKDLEDYLGFKLFDRMSNRIFLNESGRIFLSKTNELLKLYDHLDEYSKTIEDEAPIIIGSSITIAMDFLPKVIQEFKQRYPKTPIEVHVKNAEDIEILVQENRLDFGLVEGAIRNEDFDVTTFHGYDLVVLASKENSLDEHEVYDLDTLVSKPFLLREKGSAIRDTFDSELLIKGYIVNPQWTSINSQVLINAASQNLGLTVLPKNIVTEHIKEGRLKVIKIKDLSLSNENHLIVNRNKTHTQRADQFMDLIKKRGIIS